MKTTKLFSLVLLVSQLHVFAGSQPEDFVAHEWGTFTSVQGADGIQLEWNPLTTTELPGFVYDRNRPGGNPIGQPLASSSSKSAFVTLQRMETPVIYFYSGQERTVDVAVKFPQGIITEWYPQVASLSRTDKSDLELSQQHGIRWSGVQVLPGASNQALQSLLPIEKSGSHYYAARQAEADFLKINGAPSQIRLGGTSPKTEYEKFLFYRGVGSFRAPLQVTMSSGEETMNLTNTGIEELTDLFVMNLGRVTGQSSLAGKFIYVDRLSPGESKMVSLNPQKDLIALSDLRPQIMQRVQQSLAAKGLYGAEAKAMVQTWQDSWFGEEGVRVLYALPRKWTDQILPLTLNPSPRELVRVMVGRAEVITPTMERQLRVQIVKFGESDPVSRQRVIEETRGLGLGRFVEPAVRRVLGKTPTREFSQQAWSLIEALRATGSGGKALAVK